MTLYTIGFTKKTAEQFFGLLEKNGVQHVIDTRLRPDSQLSGFAKGRDLSFFLRRISQIGYEHRPEFGATDELMDAYRAKKMTWEQYAAAYVQAVQQRGVLDTLRPDDLDGACLLCSEDKSEKCHRSLLADMLQKQYPDLRIVHL